MKRGSSTLISGALLRRWPLPKPDESTGKEGRGTVLVVGGSQQIPGAAILAAIAALRAGAGKLQIATGGAVAPMVAVAVPEARVIGLRQTRAGELHATACRAIRDEMRGCDALLIGPGMAPAAGRAATDLLRLFLAPRRRARGARTVAGASSPLSGGRSPTVILDAGALEAFAGRKRLGPNFPGSVIATPHAGEMANLWGISRDQVLADPAALSVRAARDLGVVLVLKGACTYVATPAGKVFHNTAGNTGLGTSGSGDTLSGVIAGLCARGAAPAQAAAWGVFVHATAGDVLAAKVGGLGFLARELLAEVPPLLSRFSRR